MVEFPTLRYPREKSRELYWWRNKKAAEAAGIVVPVPSTASWTVAYFFLSLFGLLFSSQSFFFAVLVLIGFNRSIRPWWLFTDAAISVTVTVVLIWNRFVWQESPVHLVFGPVAQQAIEQIFRTP
jgi:hypothetical protein